MPGAIISLLTCLAGLTAVTAYKINHDENIKIITRDNVTLRGDVFYPTPETPGEVFPVVVFVNSWAVPQFEYFAEAAELCAKGFVTFSYEARGWYLSGGKIGTAGALDQEDSIVVIDLVVASAGSWHVDTKKIAAAGISYGAGLALLAAANDPRVSVAVPLSGWGSIFDSLDEGFSPNLIWGTLLVDIAHVVGRPDPELDAMWQDLLHFRNISAVQEFAFSRSPEDPRFLQGLIDRKVAVLMSNNMEDRLFKPQFSLRFWDRLTGPKKMLLNQGIHATAELGGSFALPNYVWEQVFEWLMYYMRGEGPKPSDGTVTFQLRNKKQDRITVGWNGGISPSITRTPYYLQPRTGLAHFGGLHSQPSSSSTTIEFAFARDSGMNAGVPLLGEIVQVFVDIPILCDLATVSNKHAALFQTPKLSSETRLCGNVRLSFPFQVNFGRWQLVAYLYATDPFGVGTLISHGTQSCWNCTAGEAINQVADMTLRTLCYDVPKGHSITLGVDMYSDLYQPANTDSKLRVAMGFGEKSVLHLDLQALGAFPRD